MDRYERMQIRAYADWRERLKSADGALIVDPTTGQIVPDPESHHIAGVKYGELAVPLSKATHAEMTRRQTEEHPPDGADPDHPIERAARFLLGAADLLESIVDELRRVGELLIDVLSKDQDRDGRHDARSIRKGDL